MQEKVNKLFTAIGITKGQGIISHILYGLILGGLILKFSVEFSIGSFTFPVVGQAIIAGIALAIFKEVVYRKLILKLKFRFFYLFALLLGTWSSVFAMAIGQAIFTLIA